MNGYADWRPPDRPVPGINKKKEVKRPKFSLAGVIADFLLPLLLVAVGIYSLSNKGIISAAYVKTCVLFAFSGYILLRLKQVILWLILIYQKYAPEHVRKACVFEPTCSEYMYRAICKYGLVAGILRGIGRLLRCHEPNGGKDEP